MESPLKLVLVPTHLPMLEPVLVGLESISDIISSLLACV